MNPSQASRDHGKPLAFLEGQLCLRRLGVSPDPLEMGREVDICGCVRLYSAGPRCQGTNLGQPQSRGSTSSPSPVASAVLGGNAMALCRRWRYSRDRGSTAIRRTTQSYSTLSRFQVWSTVRLILKSFIPPICYGLYGTQLE